MDERKKNARIVAMRFELDFSAAELGRLEVIPHRTIYHRIIETAGSSKPELSRVPLKDGLRLWFALEYFGYEETALARALEVEVSEIVKAIAHAKSKVKGLLDGG